MKYSVVYSSKTGNTRSIAEGIVKHFGEEDLIYMGEAADKAKEADLIFVGSWTDKGMCDGETKVFLEELNHKKVFIFGTCGFGGGDYYFDEIAKRNASFLNDTNEVVGSFVCCGKMPLGIRKKYEKMLETNPDSEKIKMFIDNFDMALAHPNNEDFLRLESCLNKIKF